MITAVSRQGCGGLGRGGRAVRLSVCRLRQQKILFSWLGLSSVCFAINLVV